MTTIPKDQSIDSTLAVLNEGFTFLQNRFQRLKSDIFQTRMMGQKVICLHGEEAARVFYDPEYFVRKGAVPKRIQKTLLGEEGIQTLDDAAHRHRKALFMSLMTPASIRKLMDLISAQLQQYGQQWEQAGQVVIFWETQDLLCRAACAWAGVPLPEAEVTKRAGDFGAMVDAFGGLGPRHSRGKQARQRTEKWIGALIEQIRKGQLDVPQESAAYLIAFHRELDGNLLDTHVAAVELINLIRPIVAISWYITFAALALHQHPECRQKLQVGEEEYAGLFVQEVRRYYPFAPFVGARVRKDFSWNGFRFPKGTLVLLDVYGTLHDARYWPQPDMFYPERFRNWNGSSFSFIPQGGGEYNSGHRCAGEWITIETTKLIVRFLADSLTYEVPNQDLSFSLSRIPTIPRTGFVIRNVRRVAKRDASQSIPLSSSRL